MTPPNGTTPVVVTPRPTSVRYSVLSLLCLLAMITYMDRAMYGSAKRDLMASVGQPVENFFWVLVAFQLAYACFEIPTGWLGDTFGPRSTLLRIVAWWSAFVALTAVVGLAVPGAVEVAGLPVAAAFIVLIAVQFLFGMGEAGAFPNIAKAVYNWFPVTQRGFAKGAVWTSARFMGGLTPFIWVLLVELAGLSWRQALWLFAGLAALWCLIFWAWFRNKPGEHPATNAGERELISGGRHERYGYGGVPWGKIYTSRNVWFLCLMYMATNFNWYFLMYYVPGALKDQFPDWNASPGGKLLLAVLGGAPLLVGMFGCMLGGVLTDRYIRRTGDRKWGRRIFAMIGYGLAGLFYLAAAGVKWADPNNADPTTLWTFAGCLMMVGFCNDLIMAPAWAAAQDIGRRYAAIVSGTMNMVGNLGAVLGIFVTGQILKAYTTDGVVHPTGFITCFVMYFAVYSAGVGTWLMIDATKPVAEEE